MNSITFSPLSLLLGFLGSVEEGVPLRRCHVVPVRDKKMIFCLLFLAPEISGIGYTTVSIRLIDISI